MQEEIADLVHPVFAYGLRLKERLGRGESPVLDTEQSTLKGLLLTESEARRWVDFGGETIPGSANGGYRGDEAAGRAEPFLGIRYALVSWLDELFILDSPWEARWNERKLEVALYGTNDRAWKFWDQARWAGRRPAGDALEVFYLCVMLGFRGELREDPDKLRAWMASTRTQIARGQGQEWRPPPELEPPTYVPPLHGRRRLQRMILVGGLLVLLLIPVVALILVQQLGQ